MAVEEKEEIAQPVDRHAVLTEQFTQAEETEKAERARDETGKFAKTETPKASKEPVQSKPGTTPPVTGQPAPVDDPVWKRPPASWKKEYHEAWKTADPKFQEYAFQREEQMRAGVEPLKTKAEFADSVNKVIEPYLPIIRGLGATPEQAIGALMQADAILRSPDQNIRRNYFLQLAQQYGIDISGAPQEQRPVDPLVYNLQNQLLNLTGQVQTWQQQQEQAQNATYLSEINKFSANAEHFETLRPQMIQLLQSGVADDLPDAYNKALRLNDELFEAEQTRKHAESAAANSASLNKAAKAAKAAAVSVKTSTPGIKTATKAQDRRSVLEEAFSNIEGRI